MVLLPPVVRLIVPAIIDAVDWTVIPTGDIALVAPACRLIVPEFAPLNVPPIDMLLLALVVTSIVLAIIDVPDGTLIPVPLDAAELRVIIVVAPLAKPRLLLTKMLLFRGVVRLMVPAVIGAVPDTVIPTPLVAWSISENELSAEPPVRVVAI
jgi:hypothetical protein